ncbi:efflux RND transporter periplasmic adaptor subunit [Parasphingopyxis lamellibrachiae]|uniref:HlyD family secretion protein n=1 Tax=Parasphingopyxis lamellibrachiae TaxID=680125 RepID=A0A3D9FJG8_9SPHN|nr:HlyD family efflux transporter periplasmic adaptor subunit [Parasphingopyxis lamellibrachiae]RED17798.1 HlyD family secretion protein [Parasphingopyxis lamellibrachiae]
MLEKLKRWRWAILIAALFILGLGYSFWPEAVPVDTGEVTRGPMTVGITDDGVTRVHDAYIVSAPVSGYVTRIEIEPGDRVVARETIIARMAGRPSTPLDTRSRRELQNALAAARAAERSARARTQSAIASLDLARRELARAEALAERGFLPQSRLDAARTEAAARGAALAAARANVEQNRSEVGRIRASLNEPATGTPTGSGPVAVRSPTSGTILRILHESEGVVAEGTPLVEIGDPEQIEIVVDLLSREAVRVRPGAPVAITRWGGEEVLAGRIRRIEPFGELKISALGIEEQRVNVIIDFNEPLESIARLGHGYQVDATITVWSREDALRVPIGAIFRSGADWHVYVVSGGRAVERPVEIGHINDEHAEVLGGLDEDEEVIVNPGNRVADGRRITNRN